MASGRASAGTGGGFSVVKMHAWLFAGKRRDFRELLQGLLCGQFCTTTSVIQVLCGCEFFTVIIARSRVRPESHVSYNVMILRRMINLSAVVAPLMPPADNRPGTA